MSEVQRNIVHNFIKDTGFGIRTVKDKPVITKFLEMLPVDQREILEQAADVDTNNRRDHIIAKIKNYEIPKTIVEIPSSN